MGNRLCCKKSGFVKKKKKKKEKCVDCVTNVEF